MFRDYIISIHSTARVETGMYGRLIEMIIISIHSTARVETAEYATHRIM